MRAHWQLRGLARVFALVSFGVCLTASSVRAETVEDAYRGAMKDYYAARYARAARRLERLVGLPLHNEELFYNLGCAYYRAGKLGPAIFNYERALALDPGFDNARYNLETARAEASRTIKDVLEGAAGERWWVGLVKLFSSGTWWVLLLGLWWLTLGMLFLSRYVSAGPARAGLVAANSFVALLALLAGLLLAGRIYATHGVREGVVLPNKVTVREGPHVSARSSFKLHAGLKVRLQNESSGWVRIRLSNGLEGWIQRRELGILQR